MGFNIVNFLLQKEKVKQKIKQDKKHTLKSKKELEDELETTFKPKTNNYVHNIAEYESTSGNRNDDLYNKVRKGQYALKHNKEQEEYEYDKSYKECTRQPKIN